MSAAQKIKNHLAYKLGQSLLDYDKAKKESSGGGGLIPLLFKLYQIKKEHKTLTKFRKTLELARSDLALPPLQNCPDFNEAIWIKSQLSYRLGQVLIECDKAKFKGAYLSFFKKVEKCKKEFHAFRKSKAYLFRTKLKFQSEKDFDALLKHYLKLEELWVIAKFYTPLLHTLTLNLDFVMKNLEIITAWLKSETFKDKYEKTKHPYPPLLNPDILNELLECGCDMEALKSKEVSSEEFKEALEKVSLNKLSSEAKLYIKSGLDYRLIPASLAWDLNLSLPSVYGFVMFLYNVSAHWTLILFFERILKIDFCMLQHSIEIHPNLNNFYGNLRHKDLAIYSRWFTNYNETYKKHYLSSHLPFIILVRCPISRLKSLVNHGGFKFDFQATQIDFNLGYDIDKVLDRKVFHDGSDTPILDGIPLAIDVSEENFSYTSTAKICQNNVHYIDASEIDPQNVIQTMRKYALFFNKNLDEENLIKNELYLKEKKSSELDYLIPLTLNIPFKDKVLKIEICLKQQNNLIDFSKKLFNKDFDILKLVAFAMTKEDFDALASCSLLNEVQLYLNEFIIKLEAKWKGYLRTYVKEDDILLYFKNNRNLALKFKKILDKELSHLKEHRPDIVASWKHYGKFEKICKDLGLD